MNNLNLITAILWLSWCVLALLKGDALMALVTFGAFMGWLGFWGRGT